MNHLRLKKRGQTVYIIIGILALTVIVFGLYIYSSRAKGRASEEETNVLEKSVIPSLSFYMKQSIDKASIDVIKEIGAHGGLLEPELYTWTGATKVAYTCHKDDPGSAKACKNVMITRQHIEQQLADNILKNLNGIIDLKSFRDQGIDIKEGERKVKVILGKTALVIELDYPLELSVENKVEKIDIFQSTIKLPLGILYDLSTYITNAEMQEKEFNITEWYQKHPDLFITLEREKMGADWVYQLVKDDYPFNFALQKTGLQEAENGCCYNRYDFSCFKNVQKEQCDEIQGQYDPNPLCYCPTEGRLSCVISLPDAGCTEPYAEVLKLSYYENAHASLPDQAGFRHSMCCNIVAFYLTQQPDIVGRECTGNGAVFARLSSAENGHVDDPGNTGPYFTEKACISAKRNRISCMAREGICLGEEEPIISFMQPVNSHAGYSYKYDTKICCKAEKIT
ncbi:hypothetical protein COV19_05315 [Candidatus Woesearchaeota archaeon CG10_big_fil_rev_8_21_14_0_10_44_13]|nr:MAG: hypothetical protein COV19_05315 [Candidatus Woesearchaeota archaeon CG10_big_fil_rev_8_21_14_0_10_44_13]